MQFIKSRVEPRQLFSTNPTSEMQRFLAANKEKSTSGNSKDEDDDVPLLLSGEDGEQLSFSSTADDSRLLLQLQPPEDADASDSGTQGGWHNTQVPQGAAARPGDDGDDATNDNVGFITPASTSATRRVIGRTYPRFHQPIGYVSLPMVDVNDTDLELDRGQSIALPPIPTEEEDAKAVKQFAMNLVFAFAFLSMLYMFCVGMYLFSEYSHSNRASPPSPALKFVPLTCGLFITVGVKIAQEAVAARKKRLMEDARCYAGLSIFFVFLALAGSAAILALRIAVTSNSIDSYSVKALFG